MSKSTAVFPSKYYFEELEKVDPRFYVQKDIVVLVPHEIQGAPTPEQAIVLNTSVTSETLLVIKDVGPKEESKKE